MKPPLRYTELDPLTSPLPFTLGHCQVNRTRSCRTQHARLRCLCSRPSSVSGHTLYTCLITKPRVVRHSHASKVQSTRRKKIYIRHGRQPGRSPVSLAFCVALFIPLYKALYRGNMPGTQCGFMYRKKKLKEKARGAKTHPCGIPSVNTCFVLASCGNASKQRLQTFEMNHHLPRALRFATPSVLHYDYLNCAARRS